MLYDKDSLLEHLRSTHTKCELCAKLNVKDSYWTDTNELVQHYSEAHFTCGFQVCAQNYIAFVDKKEMLEHMLQFHSEELPEPKLQQYQKELLVTTKQIDVSQWDKYQEKYSYEQRAVQIKGAERTQHVSKNEEKVLQDYFDQIQLQSVLKKSEKETKHRADDLGQRYVEFVEEQPSEPKVKTYKGMSRVEKATEEDVDEELLQAKPVMINNIKKIINPQQDDDFLIIGKAKQRKQKNRPQDQQEEGQKMENGLFGFVGTKPKVEEVEQEVIQFVKDFRPQQTQVVVNEKPKTGNIIEFGDLQIVKKKEKKARQVVESKPADENYEFDFRVVVDEPEVQSQNAEPKSANVSKIVPSQLKKNCAIVNLSTFDAQANEVTIVRMQNGQVIATLHYLCKYSGKFVDQFKNVDKAQFKGQEKLQKLAFFTKIAYGEFLAGETQFFKVAMDTDAQLIATMVSDFCFGDAVQLERTKSQFKGEAQITVLNKNIDKITEVQFLLAQQEEENKAAQSWLKSLKLNIPYRAFQLEDTLDNEQQKQLLDKLAFFQKHQYCPYHAKQNAKCTYDWALRSAEFLAGLKLAKQEEIMIEVPAQKPIKVDFKIQNQHEQEQAPPKQSPEEVQIQKINQLPRKQKAQPQRTEPVTDGESATLQFVQQMIKKERKTVQQLSSPFTLFQVLSYGKHINEVAAIRMANKKPAALLHFFVQQPPLQIEISPREEMQKIPAYNSQLYKQFLADDQFTSHCVVQAGDLKLEELLQQFSSGSSEDLQILKQKVKIVELQKLEFQKAEVFCLHEYEGFEQVVGNGQYKGKYCCAYHKKVGGECAFSYVMEAVM